MITTYEDTGWVEELIAVLAKAVPPITPGSSVPRRGQLLVAKATNRRASVLWATEARVCICYLEDWSSATRIFDMEAFVRLYTPIQ